MDEIEKMTKEQMEVEKPDSNDDSERRKGYIGLTLGVSIPVGDFANDMGGGAANVGAHLNLVNFGYLFSEHLGISATWFGGANPVNVEGLDPWSYGGLMVGPLLSFPITKQVEWDFRPMIGYSVSTITTNQFGDDDASAFAFNIGSVFRINVGEKVSLLLSADYFSTNPEFEGFGISQRVSTISIGFGVAYRLK